MHHLIFRVAALHGLILALVFAEELGNSDALIQSVNSEATQLESIYFDADRHGGGQTKEIRQAIAFYTREVIEREWELLNSESVLSNDAWSHREKAMQALLDLEVDTPRQTWLRQRMLDQLAAVETERNRREILAAIDVSMLFWVIAFIGVALVAAPYFPYQPTTANMALLAIYAAYPGLVLYFIYAFDSPFSGFGGVQPIPLELLYHEFLHAEIADLLPAPANTNQ
ncbi:MAG: DUF4239 domain-containing protein [Hyphomicrobiales bacterium]|nr:DUF4239 domain-containing protein [Hyphomicrobiales bacterium]MCP4999701.1 DUF4239 domain-containing protein [Hyphomicrobiales bacterium]